MRPNWLRAFGCSKYPMIPSLTLLATCLIVLTLVGGLGMAATITGGQATILSPNRIGGASDSDERAVDIYPAVAYDPTNQRYLAVWMTMRNAQSESDGFDVYGVFLNPTGQPSGSEFRISDRNTAARSGFPTVVTGNGEFIVAWAAKDGACKIYAQRVTDTSARSDSVLVSGADHNHSPSLVYNPSRQRYALAFVEGDDYLPPVLFGTLKADCGNNASSTSRVKAVEFHFSGNTPIVDAQLDVSDVNGGGFRPRVAYSSGLNQYLVAWEDRRNAGGQAYRFDVYGQRLGGDLGLMGGDMSLATGGDYTNEDTSATWTPRPGVAGSNTAFLVTCFAREAQGEAVIWSLIGKLVPASGSPGTAFPIARMTFAQPHPGRAPAGFLATTYNSVVDEFMVGLTSHLETVWGYISLALVQRVSSIGELLNLDGSVKSQPGVGNSVDYDNDDQISVGMAVNSMGETGASEYLVVYGKHAPREPAQDFDIWGVRVQMPASPTATPTPIHTPTPTATPTMPSYRVFLPIIMKNYIP